MMISSKLLPKSLENDACEDVNSPEEAYVLFKTLNYLYKQHKLKTPSICAKDFGIKKNIAIVKHKKQKLYLINPKITKKSDKKIIFSEKSSRENNSYNTHRFNKITIENLYMTEPLELNGELAFLVQQVVDYMSRQDIKARRY